MCLLQSLSNQWLETESLNWLEVCGFAKWLVGELLGSTVSDPQHWGSRQTNLCLIFVSVLWI